jgi:dual specificity MAP kinase phosphatase
VFERDYPDLVSLDSRGKPLQHIDFMAREKEEMRQLTQATLICDNVWVRAIPSLIAIGIDS